MRGVFVSREQRRALIAESLKSDPQLSNRAHARRTGADHKTVQAVREVEEESGEIPHFSKRVDPRTGNMTQPALQPREPKPKATVMPQADLDALNTPRNRGVNVGRYPV